MADNQLNKSVADNLIQDQSEEESERGPYPAPDGFTILTAPDGEKYMIPTFLGTATSYAYYREQAKDQIDLDNAAGGVSFKLALRPY